MIIRDVVEEERVVVPRVYRAEDRDEEVVRRKAWGRTIGGPWVVGRARHRDHVVPLKRAGNARIYRAGPGPVARVAGARAGLGCGSDCHECPVLELLGHPVHHESDLLDLELARHGVLRPIGAADWMSRTPNMPRESPEGVAPAEPTNTEPTAKAAAISKKSLAICSPL